MAFGTTTHSNIYRLFRSEESNEEWTVRIQGVVCDRILPPYRFMCVQNSLNHDDISQ